VGGARRRQLAGAAGAGSSPTVREAGEWGREGTDRWGPVAQCQAGVTDLI
jgi:hypothetical protein